MNKKNPKTNFGQKTGHKKEEKDPEVDVHTIPQVTQTPSRFIKKKKEARNLTQ